MTQETIDLLTILLNETQSRTVFARCEAEIKRLETPSPKTLINPFTGKPCLPMASNGKWVPL